MQSGRANSASQENISMARQHKHGEHAQEEMIRKQKHGRQTNRSIPSMKRKIKHGTQKQASMKCHHTNMARKQCITRIHKPDKPNKHGRHKHDKQANQSMIREQKPDKQK
jgi:hypothetical protein